MVYDNYWNEKQQYDQSQQAQTKTILPNPAESPLFNYATLFRTIDDRNNMTDSELRYFIHMNFSAIINSVFNDDVARKYTIAFQDTRFLDAFIDVLYKVQYFDPDTIIRINLIIYHYFALSKIDQDPEVISRMMKIASITNRSKAIGLKQFNLPSNLENCLLIARYSDFNLNICVKRVNLMLVTNQELVNMLTPDDIYEASEKSVDLLANILVEIYSLDTWNYVLPYFMVDVLPSSDDTTPELQWITPEVEAIDSILSLAVLQVLDTKIESSAKLKNILVNYAEGYRIMNYKKPVRFSFRSISGDYPRVRNVVDYMTKEDHIYIP